MPLPRPSFSSTVRDLWPPQQGVGSRQQAQYLTALPILGVQRGWLKTSEMFERDGPVGSRFGFPAAEGMLARSPYRLVAVADHIELFLSEVERIRP